MPMLNEVAETKYQTLSKFNIRVDLVGQGLIEKEALDKEKKSVKRKSNNYIIIN